MCMSKDAGHCRHHGIAGGSATFVVPAPGFLQHVQPEVLRPAAETLFHVPRNSSSTAEDAHGDEVVPVQALNKPVHVPDHCCERSTKRAAGEHHDQDEVFIEPAAGRRVIDFDAAAVWQTPTAPEALAPDLSPRTAAGSHRKRKIGRLNCALSSALVRNLIDQDLACHTCRKVKSAACCWQYRVPVNVHYRFGRCQCSRGAVLAGGKVRSGN